MYRYARSSNRLDRHSPVPMLAAPRSALLKLATLSLAIFYVVVLSLVPGDAIACGGCFSPPPTAPGPGPNPGGDQTVVQDAERVVFTTNPTTGVTRVWVEVRYTGVAKDFGWVLPLPKQPIVSVGTTVALDVIDGRTAPIYKAVSAPTENCRRRRDGCKPQPSSRADAMSGGASDAQGSDGGGGSAPGVKLLDAGQTGPYDYAVVKSTSAAALQQWLKTRGYQIPAKAKPIIQSHLDKGDVFVAIKLSNGNGVNLIRPIVLEMKDADPCVPLRLTSIASADELSVVVTLGGSGRAVPKNMLHVQLNQALINWFKGGNNYDNLLAAAVDEAGGRAFTTQSSMTGATLGSALWTEASLRLKSLDGVKNLYDLAKWLNSANEVWLHNDAAELIAQKTGLKAVLSEAFGDQSTLRTLQQLWVCGAIWRGTVFTNAWPLGEAPCVRPGAAINSVGPTLVPKKARASLVDGASLAAALKKDIATPMLQLFAELKASPRVTRLSMRISPDEMDRDPIFGFHPNLPMVSQTRTAQLALVCSQGWEPADMRRLTIPGVGSYLFPLKAVAPGADPRFNQAPVARVVEILDESGPPVPVAAKQIELVDTALAGAVLGKPSPTKALALTVPTPWQPPPSQPKVTLLTPWQRPFNCQPKAGWADGKLPPDVGGFNPPQPDAGASDSHAAALDGATGPDSATRNPDGSLKDAGAQGGGSQGGGGAGKTQKPQKKQSSGCSAGAHGDAAAPWWLLLLAAIALVSRRRRARRLGRCRS